MILPQKLLANAADQVIKRCGVNFQSLQTLLLHVDPVHRDPHIRVCSPSSERLTKDRGSPLIVFNQSARSFEPVHD